jgi:hypothetical protein
MSRRSISLFDVSDFIFAICILLLFVLHRIMTNQFSINEKIANRIIIGIIIILICIYLYIAYLRLSYIQRKLNEDFTSTSPVSNVSDALNQSREVNSTKILADLYIEVNANKEKETMCNLITNSAYRADIYNVYFLLDSMRIREIMDKSSRLEYNIEQLQNANSIISDLVNRFVFMDSTLDDIYIIKYGDSCRRNKSLKTTFNEDYRNYIETLNKGVLTQLESSNTSIKKTATNKALCPLYSGNYQESLTRVMNILISISHFYTKRINTEIPKKYKENLDRTIYQLYIIRKHVNDLMNSADKTPITTVRKLFC